MKTQLALLLLLVFTPALLAQEGKKETDKEYEAIRAELRKLREQATEAVNKQKIDQLLPVVHDDVIFVAPAVKKELIFNRGHKGVKEYYAEMFGGTQSEGEERNHRSEGEGCPHRHQRQYGHRLGDLG